MTKIKAVSIPSILSSSLFGCSFGKRSRLCETHCSQMLGNLKESSSPSWSSHFPQTCNARGAQLFFCSLGRFVVKISRAGRLLRDTSRLAGWETATVFRNCVEFWPPSHFQQISSAVPAGERDVACFLFFLSHTRIVFTPLNTITDVVKLYAALSFLLLSVLKPSV